MASFAILFILALATLPDAFGTSSSSNLLDCLINPCLNVPGVGKLKGSKKYSSWEKRTIYSYYSIPYGKPTSGERRFSHPEEADPVNDGSSKVFDATYLTYVFNALKRVCPQPGLAMTNSYLEMFSDAPIDDLDNHTTLRHLDETNGAVAGTEDCLHLAVFTPRSPEEVTAKKKPLLPVMFFIHGGAFYQGTYFAMGPKHLLDKDVVLVEIQYRLGPLGFMCLDHPDAAGNMGLLDQLLALKWVKKHIASFGGNPDDITLFGESAGSASVSYHAISPLSNSLFQKAIGQSGSALAGWAFDAKSDKHAKEIAKRLGCPTDNLDELIKCMKFEKTMEEIISTHQAYIKEERFNGRMGFGGSTPCVQTAGKELFITKPPEEYLRSGDYTPKKMMFGANKHEGSFVLGVMYNSYIKPHKLEHDESYLKHRFIPIMLDALGLMDTSGVIYEIMEHDYFDHGQIGSWDKMMPGMINLVGTFFIKASGYEFMKYNEILGGESFFYSFEYEGKNSIFKLIFPKKTPPIPHGCTHGDDLIYLFSMGLFRFSNEDWEMSKKMVNIWTNFAIYGEPTPSAFVNDNSEFFPKWTEGRPDYLVLNMKSKVVSDYIDAWKTL